jgi:hypothetical protein
MNFPAASTIDSAKRNPHQPFDSSFPLPGLRSALSLPGPKVS